MNGFYNREELIDELGIMGANIVEGIWNEHEEIREYLGVVRVATTQGFKLEKDASKMKLGETH